MLNHRHIDCATPGCFAIITMHPADEARLRETHAPFYCPAGHSNVYLGKTEQEKRIDELKHKRAIAERWWHEWRERWERESDRVRRLVRGMQVCPLGCGWQGHRRLPHNATDAELDRFLDRAGTDLAYHLRMAHYATIGTTKLLPAGDA